MACRLVCVTLFYGCLRAWYLQMVMLLVYAMPNLPVHWHWDCGIYQGLCRPLDLLQYNLKHSSCVLGYATASI